MNGKLEKLIGLTHLLALVARSIFSIISITKLQLTGGDGVRGSGGKQPSTFAQVQVQF